MDHLQLAIDTSTSFPVAAILAGERTLADWRGPEGLRHHETLLAGIDECFTRAGVAKNDLHFLSVGIGPGMFTGLRIGVTTAKFLADVLGLSCVPVSSLMAQAEPFAHEIRAGKRVWALSDAKSRRLYAFLASPESLTRDFTPPSEEEVALTPEEVLAKLKPGDWLVGEGAGLYKDLWSSQPRNETPLSGAAVGRVGLERYRLALTCTATELLPKYLKTGQSHL